MDVIGELIADVEASGYEQARIAADAGIAPSTLSRILNREQLPTVSEYFAIRRAIGRETPSDDVIADLERLHAAMAGDQPEQLTEILEDLLRGMDRGSE